ncbi:hypothetical protein [Streptomyces albipurpureus]|uniref:Uncharacterized protein n=1 Tax=Streptomyces albipurpureus TaxID=2897419 RepID=A0ABT0UJP8_9ACTN|nr:hypothetical protein [Streptomyces sp. CWNU-1]MCM2387506.1 hypothetical protein [Streptomyces sp. CWNU-1]
MRAPGPLDPRRVGVHEITGKLGEGRNGPGSSGRSPGERWVDGETGLLCYLEQVRRALA